MAHPLPQYLERYAEPEAAEIAPKLGAYGLGLSVPLRGESPRVVERYEAACAVAAADGMRVLVVFVVNGSGSSAPAGDPDLGFVEAARRYPGARQLGNHTLLPQAWGDVLVVDRVSSGLRFSAKEGAGLARKIGADILLHLWARGRLSSPWLFGSDADTSLPPRHFAEVLAAKPADAAALLLPFKHVPVSTAPVNRATQVYELWLRYYRAGLAWAGSPFAFIALGGAMVVHAQAYAEVRGFSKRLAGEDHYTLDKLAKLRPLGDLRVAPVLIDARLSSRVPFGTGPQVKRLVAAGSVDAQPFFAPEVFLALRLWLQALARFARHRDVGRLNSELMSAPDGPLIVQVLSTLGALTLAERAATQTADAHALLRRLHGWFDGLRTLQFLHALRDLRHPSGEWRGAVARAPFSPLADRPLASLTVESALNAFYDAPRPPTLGVEVACDCALADTGSRL